MFSDETGCRTKNVTGRGGDTRISFCSYLSGGGQVRPFALVQVPPLIESGRQRPPVTITGSEKEGKEPQPFDQDENGVRDSLGPHHHWSAPVGIVSTRFAG